QCARPSGRCSGELSHCGILCAGARRVQFRAPGDARDPPAAKGWYAASAHGTGNWGDVGCAGHYALAKGLGVWYKGCSLAEAMHEHHIEVTYGCTRNRSIYV